MSERTVIATDGAPRPYAGAPYNQAVKAGGLVFCAGQVGLDPASGQMVSELSSHRSIPGLGWPVFLDCAFAPVLVFFGFQVCHEVSSWEI